MPPRNPEIVSPGESEDWDAEILEHPACSVFHSAAWSNLLAETYGYEPLYLVSRATQGITYCLPLMQVHSALTGVRGVSLPFSDVCRPMGTWPTQADAPTALDACLRIGRTRHWRYVEFRGCISPGNPPPASASYIEHVLELAAGEVKLFEAFRGSIRQAIRKGDKLGLKVTLNQDEKSLAEFRRLNCLTRREHGLPPQPGAFFHNLYKHVLSRGMGHVALAHYEGRPVAAAVFLHFGKTALFKYGASHKKYQHLRGNACVMWKAIRHYARAGFSILSMGRTHPSNAGLRRFKDGWGTTGKTVFYCRYDFRKSDFVTRHPNQTPAWTHLFRYLPLPISQAVGNLAYRHMA